MDLIKCYSFKTGSHLDSAKKWRHLDWKIPAPDLRAAVLLFFILDQYKYRTDSRVNRMSADYKSPSRDYIFLVLREVVEWEISKKRGFFLVQYKKVKRHTVYEVLTLFK